MTLDTTQNVIREDVYATVKAILIPKDHAIFKITMVFDSTNLQQKISVGITK